MLKARKSLSIILMLSLMASIVLTSCAGGTPAAVASENTPAASENAEVSAVDDSSKEPVLLNVWLTGTAQDQSDRVEQALNAYLKDTVKSNIQVNIEELGWNDEYTQKVNNALSTGQDVDIVFTANWCANVQQNAMDGYFLPLTNYLTQYPDVVKILGQDYINSSKINNETFALPCNKEKFHNWGFLLRTDLVKKYAIDITKIRSIKDLEPYFEKVLAGEPGITPIALQGMDVPQWKFLDWDNISDDDVPGALYPVTDASNTKIINQFTAPEAVAVYKEMKEYLAKGYISADASTAPGVSDLLKTGQFFAAVQSLKPGKDAEMIASTGIEYVQVDITKQFKTNRETTGAMLAITKQSKHPDEAMKFISWLYTDPTIINMIIYGQEGKDYTLNADGTVTPISGSGYASGNGWRFGDQLKNLRLSFETADKYQQFEALNNSAPMLYSYGFMLNKDTNMQTLIANTRAVTQEYYKTLLCGQAKDVDKLVAEMDAKYKAAGSEELLASMQKQYDEWIKTAKQ